MIVKSARFWRMLANDQGDLFNREHFANSLGVSGTTVARGFHHAATDVNAERRILGYSDTECFPMRGAIEAMRLLDAMGDVGGHVALE